MDEYVNHTCMKQLCNFHTLCTLQMESLFWAAPLTASLSRVDLARVRHSRKVAMNWPDRSNHLPKLCVIHTNGTSRLACFSKRRHSSTEKSLHLDTLSCGR